MLPYYIFKQFSDFFDKNTVDQLLVLPDAARKQFLEEIFHTKNMWNAMIVTFLFIQNITDNFQQNYLKIRKQTKNCRCTNF